jgi:hypothetical protein
MEYEKKISSFRGEYEFLSNFYHYCCIEADGCYYASVERYFQAQKNDSPVYKQAIASARCEADAKHLGRKVLLRPDWDKVKDQVMLDGLRLKFSDPQLKQKLLDTGDAYLEEGNNWGDRYWGTVKGVGKNMLGILLMQVRDELRMSNS